MATGGPPDAEPTSGGPPPSKPPSKWTSWWHAPAAQNTRTGAKTGFDYAWQQLRSVLPMQGLRLTNMAGILGEWTNKQAGKLGVESFWPTDMPRECEKAGRILWTFAKSRDEEFKSVHDDKHSHKKTQKVLRKIPPEVIEKAEGLAIYTVWRFGLGFSAASGSGIVIARDSPTTWGPPSGILVHCVAAGWLAGTDVYDVVLVLRNRRAVEAFARPKISLGAEIAAVAGPMGAGGELSSGIEASPIFSYTKSKGLYGGIQVDGNIIIERGDENERFYGRRVSARDLLMGGHAAMPAGAQPLITVIEAAEGKAIDESLLPPDVDSAPSDTVVDGAAGAPNGGAPARGTTGAPVLPVRRNVPPPMRFDDDEERIKSPLPPSGSPAPPPRPPRRLNGNSPSSPTASPRSSLERLRLSDANSPRVSSEQVRSSDLAYEVRGDSETTPTPNEYPHAFEEQKL